MQFGKRGYTFELSIILNEVSSSTFLLILLHAPKLQTKSQILRD